MFTRKINLAAAALFAAVLVATGEEPKDKLTGTTVTGRVVSQQDGKGVAGVLVTLWNGYGGQRWTARTDKAGAYAFANVKPGDDYRVWIEERPNKEAGVWSEDVVLRVKNLPVRADDLFLELPQSVSGTVTDADTGQPVPGAKINFSTANNRASVKTDSNGRYRLFVMSREIDLYCPGREDRYEESAQQHQVTVGAGKHIEKIDFKVKRSPQFTGLVLLPDGKPAKGADVHAEFYWTPLNPGGGLRDLGFGQTLRFKTDDQGRFFGHMVGIITQGRGGTVELTAIARLPDHTLGGVARAKTDDTAGYRVDPLKVTLARSSGLMVRVVNPDGAPIIDAKVTASKHFSVWGSELSGPVKEIGEGKYLILGLVPGLEYCLSIQSAGYRTKSETNELVLKPDEVRDIGDIRLDWWGKKAVPGLLKKLQSDDTYDRESAARFLGELGADGAAAVPTLIESLKQDPRNTVRFTVAEALGRIGPTAKAAVPDLIQALQNDTGGGVQREAAIALGLIGDGSALPALKDALNSSDTTIKRAAAEAIKRLEMPRTGN